MKPHDFAALLTSKLEKVIHDREMTSREDEKVNKLFKIM